MQFRLFLAVGTLSVAPLFASSAGHYATEVLSYQPGLDPVPGYDQTSVILGGPSRATSGEFGGPVDPFSGPWQTDQLLSLGAGGSVTVRFAEPVPNLADNPFGLDFLVFGSAAFIITNGDYSGGGITDGSLFGDTTGPTRVSVSVDGLSYFTLDPTLAPSFDTLFPTDGLGDFTHPVDPSLRASDFAGLDLQGIRALYDGSGGGTGFDIGWARDEAGGPVSLDAIQFVRLEALAQRAEIDALVAIPEPGVGTLSLLGFACLVWRQRIRLPGRP